ncbi:MAG: low molecular weight phosphotyrosine protein phosphatase [Cupriavidus sp.]|nr:MAG: low molecular weight phosphotyrosine protein phosphatase [Cupriavidus sp.]
MFKNILVVCTGNICRSPIADFMLREKTAGRGLNISSAGVGAMVGWPADPPAVAVAKAHGLDLTTHRARQVTEEMLVASDLVLTMDQSHNNWINARFPQFRGRVHKLLKWRENADVEDPYGRSDAVFSDCYRDIEYGVADWLKKLA